VKPTSAAQKPPLGECPLTASHTRRACDSGGSCWCIEHPEEVAQINAHPEVVEARSAATMQYELPSRLAVESGSILIERYSYKTASGRRAQWIVHRVEAGELSNLKVFDTRREAAEFVAEGLHLG